MTAKRTIKGPPRRRAPSATPPDIPPGSEEGREVGREELAGNLFSDMSEDAVVYIYRRDEISKEPVFMYKLAPDEATVDELQRLSGGGKYMCREKGRNESGNKVWLQQRTVQVGGPPREPIMPKSYVSVDEAGEVSARPGEVEVKTGIGMDEVLTAGVLKLLQGSADLSAAQAEAYKTMMTRPPEATNWEPLITAMVPVVVALIKKREDPMATMQAAASLFKDNASPAAAFREQLKTVTEVFNLQEQATPTPPDPIESALGMLPQILDIITAEQKSGRPISMDVVGEKLRAAGTVTGTAPTEATPAIVGQSIQLTILKRTIPRIKAWASQAKDPQLLADFFVAEIPEQDAGYLREFLQRDDAQEILLRVAPELKPWENWVAECFNAMADHYFPPDEDEGEEVGEEVAEPATVEVGEVAEDPADSEKMAAIDAARVAEGGVGDAA